MNKIILYTILLATVVGGVFSTRILTNINKNITEAKEASRPANIKIVKISTPDCNDCFSIDKAVDSLKKLNVNIEEEKTLEFNSAEANEIIFKFSIKKVPTYIVMGEITKNNLESYIKDNGEINNDTFVFTKTTPIFIDTTSKKEVGNIDIVYLTDYGCNECYNPKIIQKPILTSGFGISIRSERFVDISSGEGKEIIAKYNITKIPTILMSPEISEYTNINDIWKKVGKVGTDGWYVFTEFNQIGNAIYKDLTTNQIIKPEEIKK